MSPNILGGGGKKGAGGGPGGGPPAFWKAYWDRSFLV